MQSKTAWALRQVSTLPHRESDGKILLFVSAVSLFCGVGILRRYDNIIAQTLPWGNRRTIQFLAVVFGQRFKSPNCRITGLRARKIKRAGKTDPTRPSYHIQLFKSTEKCSARDKISVPHKNRCLHLGNIPSWKVEKSMLSYRHKEEIQNSKSSGGLPKENVYQGNQSDFTSK